ncbi:hypothetical protein [Novosphingobium sp. Leaf2]|uniref:hypothetical protein n=1 Tax=Novosphingobium sp. Leaf2 TaxID=1735670 RepID=UPI0006F2F746|nr:hypothetical protein [Novosphingobium sp. Leaf2]KQM21093.1 hypothetical protein ASE49_15555 [Novosphingobium sp. Leaf2]
MRIRPYLAALGLTLLAACGPVPDKAMKSAVEDIRPVPAPLTTIRSASITLPEDNQTFGDGPDGELLDRSCLACHSASMVLYQPPLNKKQWAATVDKMREAYGAPIEPKDTDAIINALMAKAPARR